MSPKRLGHPCNHPGCGAVTTGRYCARHAPLHPTWQGMATAKRAHVYDARHAAWARAVLRAHPVCACGKQATEAHHRRAVGDGGAAYDTDNGIGLCHAHHSAETAREIGARQGGSRVNGMPRSARAFCGVVAK